MNLIVKKHLVRILFAAMFLAGVLIPLAGGQSTGGLIQGTVTDASGAVIPNVTVQVRNVETGINRTLSTDPSGKYRAPDLSLGRYQVTAEANGFQAMVREGIELTVGRQAVVDFSLQVGSVAEAVTVAGEAPLLEKIGRAHV